ncbi:unnamed protein product (mitochondrion) [Plasmodiophora brassicae]|uniref:Uncharacterized protein n=1 Tax=Plasmodiophora brassicae TaxID=37360 RepID=A0A3P3YPY6_PLABS|nr:unnamed protein product [Plasmodiophora brassicae]
MASRIRCRKGDDDATPIDECQQALVDHLKTHIAPMIGPSMRSTTTKTVMPHLDEFARGCLSPNSLGRTVQSCKASVLSEQKAYISKLIKKVEHDLSHCRDGSRQEFLDDLSISALSADSIRRHLLSNGRICPAIHFNLCRNGHMFPTKRAGDMTANCCESAADFYCTIYVEYCSYCNNSELGI